MKNILGLAVFGSVLATNIANASWYQEYCSSADGSVLIANGHNANYVLVTANPATPTEERIKLVNPSVSFAESNKIESSKTKSCNNNSGYVSWEDKFKKEVSITLSDGTLLPKSLKNVSEDGKTLTTVVYCEFKGNSRASCN